MAPSRTGERGAVAVMVAISAAALLGLVALVLNVGYRLDVRGQLQNAADSAALAGARELNGRIDPIQAGLPSVAAIRFAARHLSGADVPVTIGAGDVQVGHWDPYAEPAVAFTPLAVRTAEDAWNANAVRVMDGRELARGSALSVWMSGFLGGRATQDVTAEAVAATGGPCQVDCPTVPFAFFDCGFFQNYNLNCGARVRMTASTNPDPLDTVGFTSLSLDPASTSTYREILNSDPNNCTRYQTTTGDPILISNGSQFGALCTELRARIGQKSIAPIVHDTCPPRFNQGHPVVGFATFTIINVQCSGNPKFVEFQLECNETVPDSDRIGCGFYGTGLLQPKLVR